ncbi:MAG TPA: redoxin domain-containing protein [Chitinophagales bacterium]|nr:redoxin domain-containing protein [Chitinophagales bacterium]
MAIQVGEKAPDFTLFNTEKKEVTLSSFKGKNVFLNFFPLAFTGVCTEQLCNARDHKSDYDNLNAVVLGISVDSIFSLGEFKAKQKYEFDLLSDFTKKVIKDYGVVIEKFAFGIEGIAQRAIFVADKEGVVRYAEVMADPHDLPNFEAARTVLQSLK